MKGGWDSERRKEEEAKARRERGDGEDERRRPTMKRTRQWNGTLSRAWQGVRLDPRLGSTAWNAG